MILIRNCPVTVIMFQMLSLRRVPVTVRQSVRSVYTVTEADTRALVLGVVRGKESFTLTPQAEKVNTLSGGKLVERLATFGNVVGGGEARYLGSVHPDLSPHVIAVGLDTEPGEVEENVDSVRESVRAAAGAGVRMAGGLKVKTVEMEDLGDGQAAAEGATLSNWSYQQFKSKKTLLR